LKDNTIVIINSSPYKDSQAQDGLDFVMAAAAFDLPVKILFQNDGVLNLLPNQDSSLINRDNFIDFIKAAELYEIDPIYINKSDINKYKLDLNKLLIETNIIELVEEKNLTDFYKKFNHILTY